MVSFPGGGRGPVARRGIAWGGRDQPRGWDYGCFREAQATAETTPSPLAVAPARRPRAQDTAEQLACGASHRLRTMCPAGIVLVGQRSRWCPERDLKGNAVWEKYSRSRGCPCNCKRRARHTSRPLPEGAATGPTPQRPRSGKAVYRATTREPGDLPASGRSCFGPGDGRGTVLPSERRTSGGGRIGSCRGRLRPPVDACRPFGQRTPPSDSRLAHGGRT